MRRVDRRERRIRTNDETKVKESGRVMKLKQKQCGGILWRVKAPRAENRSTNKLKSRVKIIIKHKVGGRMRFSEKFTLQYI